MSQASTIPGVRRLHMTARIKTYLDEMDRPLRILACQDGVLQEHWYTFKSKLLKLFDGSHPTEDFMQFRCNFHIVRKQYKIIGNIKFLEAIERKLAQIASCI